MPGRGAWEQEASADSASAGSLQCVAAEHDGATLRKKQIRECLPRVLRKCTQDRNIPGSPVSAQEHRVLVLVRVSVASMKHDDPSTRGGKGLSVLHFHTGVHR